MVKVLVTGGAGYIGSHACKALAKAGFEPIVYDNLQGGRRAAVKWGPLEEGDIRDHARIRDVLESYHPAAVMHFAAYIQVHESVAKPGKYYDNNVSATISLLEAMRETGIDTLVFSSSAAVFGTPRSTPTTEDEPLAPINPYGESKRMVETILADFRRAHGFKWVALRYFNAAGADPDGELGPNHEPVTHLIPLVLRAALGTRQQLTVFGTDYDTPDGTAVRDYIHVSDLASAHVAALEYLFRGGESGAFNLGNGRGHSVRDVIKEVGRILGRDVPAVDGPRRPGDAAILVADPRKSQAAFDWKPVHSSLESIVSTAARWEQRLQPDL